MVFDMNSECFIRFLLQRSLRASEEALNRTVVSIMMHLPEGYNDPQPNEVQTADARRDHEERVRLRNNHPNEPAWFIECLLVVGRAMRAHMGTFAGAEPEVPRWDLC
jgi:hypothetical protein